jgi:hypothetical protein
MKPISCLCTGLLVAALASFGYSQSLAELAKKEKERREAVKGETKVITDAEAAKFRSNPVTTTATAPASGTEKPGAEKTDATAATAPTAGAAAKDKPGSDEPVDFQGRPESYWRQAFADARQKVNELENESNVLILKLNDLQNRFYRESDGFKQQTIQKDIQKALYQQDQNKEKLAKAKEAVTDLEKEARRSGALPGWIK